MGIFANAAQQQSGGTSQVPQGRGGIFARKAQEEQAKINEEPGFFKGLARDIVKPFARFATNAVNVAQIATGNKTTKPFSGSFLGDVKPVGQEGSFGEQLKDTFGASLQVASNIPMAKGAGITYQGLKTAVKSKALLPTLAKATVPLIKEGSLAGGAYGTGKALEEQQGVGGVLKSGALNSLAGGIIAPVAGIGLPLLARGIKNVPKIKSALTPESSNIMNRVAPLSHSDATKFKQLANGESHGQYLERTGNFGDPKKIVENEAEKFTNSLKEVDDTLASLPGTYKSKPLDTVLDDLMEREAKIDFPNEESKRLKTLYNKNKKQGLDMSETNEVKRMYERNVKLGYLKENNTIGIARSTRVDDALRKWQFKTADGLGFKNLPELNKQTQLSKFIVDKVGKQISGKAGNDPLNLTDWIILSGGDPTAIGGFLTKKLLSSNKFQSGVAKLISKKTPEGPIKAITRAKPALPPQPEKLKGKALPKIIPQPEPYLSPDQMPTIEMGNKPVSKYKKSQDGLPTIQGKATTGALGLGALGLGAVTAGRTPSVTKYERGQSGKEELLKQAIPREGKFKGSNYDPFDPTQTRPNTDGKGAAGVLLDNSMVATSLKKNSDEGSLRLGTVIYIPELDEIFLVADTKNERYGENEIDFVAPEGKKDPVSKFNQNFTVQVIRQGEGKGGNTRQFVESGEWEEMKKKFKSQGEFNQK